MEGFENKKRTELNDGEKILSHYFKLNKETIQRQKKEAEDKILGFLNKVEEKSFFGNEKVNDTEVNNLNTEFGIGLSNSSDVFYLMIDNIEHRFLVDRNEGVTTKDKINDYIVAYYENDKLRENLNFEEGKSYNEVLIKLQEIPLTEELSTKTHNLLFQNQEINNYQNYEGEYQYWEKRNAENLKRLTESEKK